MKYTVSLVVAQLGDISDLIVQVAVEAPEGTSDRALKDRAIAQLIRQLQTPRIIFTRQE